MSSPDVQPSAPATQAAPTAATQGPSGATAGQFGGTVSGGTTASNMTQLKERAPQVYNAMMMGVAQNICNEMQQHQDRLKELMREGEEDANG